jgi:hypothetical protein
LADLDLCERDEEDVMLKKATQKHYYVVLVFPKGLTRTVSVRAATREVAERRAMKRNPGCVGVNRSYDA